MINKNSAPENVSDFILKSVIIESDRSPTKVDISRITTDVVIFEHLTKAYLTGSLVFVDSAGLMSKLNIDGGERVEITILSTRKDAIPIIKRFVITMVYNVIKTSDHTEVISLQLLEDHGFHSHALNVNKAYTDTPANIIAKISKDFLDKDVELSKDNFQSKIRVIVPNYDPIHAMSWVKDIATNKSGFPYFLFSSLFNSSLKFFDLETLITSKVMNSKYPYRYWQANSRVDNATIQRRTITAFKYENVDDLFTLIGNGVIGAEYSYLNTLSGVNQSFKFDVVNDVLNDLHSNILDKKQNIPLYASQLKYEDTLLNQLNSRKFTQIGGAGVYDIGGSRINSYNEASSLGEYKKKVVAKSLISFLSKSPISVAVNGLDFIDGEGNTTIGNNIRLEFLLSEVDPKTNMNKIDHKKSGNYLIYGARHVFKNERYDVYLSCAKLANPAG